MSNEGAPASTLTLLGGVSLEGALFMGTARSPVVAALVVPTALATALALAPATLAQASSPSPSTGTVQDSTLAPAASLNNSSCRSARPAIAAFPPDTSRLDEGIITLGSWTVDFRRDGWRAEHPRVQLLTRAFHSSAWLIPQDIDDLDESIRLFAEQARINPDPGATMSARALRERGWIEGHTTWRLKTALCLYRVADPAQQEILEPAIDQLIAANLDPRRYYGPPLNPAHNHGLMADRELLNAARFLDRPDLAELAVGRLELQKAEMYDGCGLNYEQASSYQFLHASLWRQLVRRIDIPRFAARITSTVQTITKASNSLAFPDGSVPGIGDGTNRSVDDLSAVDTPVRMWCPDTGWSSRRTFRGGVTQQLITRFGPATNFHGHSDKGSVVWWVGRGREGVPVLADRGTPPKTKPGLLARARSADSHAVFDWRGVSDRATTARSTRGNARETIEITSRQGDWTRSITFTPKRTQLTIEDQVAVNGSAGAARSYLPLDPVWQRTARPHVFSTDSGWRLRVRCVDAEGARVAMATDTVADYQQVPERSALRVTCSVGNAGSGIVATLTVTPPASR